MPFHPRNRHQGRYDFDALMLTHPELKKFVRPTVHGDPSVDFADAKAVKALNHALLRHFHGVEFWDIPEGYLTPPIPGRSDYIHLVADLLASQNDHEIPTGDQVRILDIGTGANCIYPLIGHSEYGWSFTAVDSNPVAYESAKRIVEKNPKFKDGIEVRLQPDATHILEGVLKEDEYFDVMICNPPFHGSLEEAEESTSRKWKNLGKGHSRSNDKPHLNFGGRENELTYPGGEIAFIKKMIEESTQFKTQCGWYSTLVSKWESLDAVDHALYEANVFEIKQLDMAQGHKKSRIVAWSFLSAD